jgi:hypothetical protein
MKKNNEYQLDYMDERFNNDPMYINLRANFVKKETILFSFFKENSKGKENEEIPDDILFVIEKLEKEWQESADELISYIKKLNKVKRKL